ncbi:hypothetical protein WJX74_008993 [Apatococcus lobatus]|uniref:Uncharacterized protein n=1 Tax=Apatococcus lobatus TaxID=904363 RepID=A0AAW1RFA1_9CHLO
MLNNQPGTVADELAAAAPSTRQPGISGAETLPNEGDEQGLKPLHTMGAEAADFTLEGAAPSGVPEKGGLYSSKPAEHDSTTVSSAQLDAEIRDMQSPARGMLAASEESRLQAQKVPRQPGQLPQFEHGETLTPKR